MGKSRQQRQFGEEAARAWLMLVFLALEHQNEAIVHQDPTALTADSVVIDAHRCFFFCAPEDD